MSLTLKKSHLINPEHPILMHTRYYIDAITRWVLLVRMHKAGWHSISTYFLSSVLLRRTTQLLETVVTPGDGAEADSRVAHVGQAQL